MTKAGVMAAAVAVLMFAWACPAGAWSNGLSGSNSYGSHDWVLDHALKAIGADADWVCSATALRATDDPDTVDGIDHASGTWWHVWDEWGEEWGGAPEAVKVWFDRARRLHKIGKDCPASRAVGIMAHLLADVAQPMHTDGSLKAEDSVHDSYEEAVDSRSERADTNFKFRCDGRDRAAPYGRTVAVARQAHLSYATLIRAYQRYGYNARVNRITKLQLNRAANAVADLIWALS